MATYTRTFGTANDYIAPSDGFSLYIIDGGAGTDTVFADTRSTGFTVSPIDSSGMVTVAGASGTTLKLTNVEKMAFKDGKVITLPVASAGPTLINGTSGNDKLTGTAGNNSIDGGAGIDSVLMKSINKAAMGITKTANGLTLSSTSTGTDTLTNVERLEFADGAVAFDLNGNAGKTAKLLGAVFGKQSVSNKEYVGIGLRELDAGMSYEALAKLAIDARLGANADKATIVNTLYTNVAGTPPSTADLNEFVKLLDNGTFTVASLTVFAADHQLNQDNISLVGLSQTGLDYLVV